MKKIFYYISAAVLVLCMAACSKEIPVVTPEVGGLMTIEANIEDGLTKASLDGNDTEGYQVIWSDGDQINIHGRIDGGQQTFTYTLTEGAGTKNGKFTGPVIPDGEYTAGYGDNLGMANGGNLRDTQNYSSSKNASCAPMMASVTVAGGVASIAKFKNICGLLRLELKGSGTIKEIKVTTNQAQGGLISLDDDGAAYVDVYPGLKYITLDCGQSGVELTSTAKPFYISMPKNDYTGVKIEVTSTNNRKFTKTLKEGKSLNIARAQITPVSFTVSGLVVPIDLSSAGTANCYIVSKGGDYYFNATKKGHTSESVGTIAYASILWESFGSDEQPKVGDIISNVSFKNGIVSFTASGANGNAVIAVHNNHNEIIWSWHIWVCNGFDPNATAQVYYNGAGTVMDRNLGATSAKKGDVRAVGLTYQWGRKDPFLNGAINAKSVGTPFDSVLSNAINGTIDYVVKHPTIYVTRNDKNGDWYYTGDSSTDDTRWISSKSKYDPCPSGWRVPDGGDNGLWAKALGQSIYILLSFDDINEGVDLTGLVSDAPEVWYPATELIVNKRKIGSGWTCTTYGTHAFEYDFRQGYFDPVYGTHRSDVKSVRCVKQ